MKHVLDALHSLLTLFFKDYEWVHICLGILGNFLFLVGSFMFFSDTWQYDGTWLFVIGSALMLIGSIGEGLRRYVTRRSNDSQVSWIHIS